MNQGLSNGLNAMARRVWTDQGLWVTLAAATLWRAVAAAQIAPTPLARWHTWDQTDMHAYLAQAQALVAGDWLGRQPLVPDHLWLQIAPPEERRTWFHPRVFYQAPLYSYFLAFLLALGIDAPRGAALLQALMGVAAAGLAWGLTRRLYGRLAAWAAGLLTACYGPLILVESQPLRDAAAVLLALAAFAAWSPRSVRRMFTAGALAGALLMLQEALGWAALVALVWAAWSAARGTVGRRWRAPAAVLAGAALGFSPLAARNVLVGAPWLATANASAMTWAMANRPAAPDAGVTWQAPGEDFARLMRDAHGDPRRLIARTLAAYEGRWGTWLGHWAQRALALLAAPDAPDNLSYAFARLHVPVLNVSVDFRWLLPPAAAGLWLRRRRLRRALGAGRLEGALLLYGILTWVAVSGVFPLGRYRLYFLPLLAPVAGWAAARAWTDWRALRCASVPRARTRLVGCMVAVALAAAAQGTLGRCWPIRELRAQDFLIAARLEVALGRPDAAAVELDRARRCGFDEPLVRAELALTEAMMLTGRGQEAAAAQRLEDALAEAPDHPAALERLARLRAAARDPTVRDAAQARALAERLLAVRGRDALALEVAARAAAANGDLTQAAALAGEGAAQAVAAGRPDLAAALERLAAQWRAPRPPQD